MLRNIALGADHRGYAHKEFLRQLPYSFIDCGAFSDERSDYPVFARAVCAAILEKRVDGGVLFCGSGAGMAIAANRLPGIYAAVAWNDALARMIREDDWCNVLVIPADFVSLDELGAIFQAWYEAIPKGGRYYERIQMIDK
ncbi:MAG: Ribose 5-phosphate isomerase B [candidate division TM6 bacterium GW2011_GWF2_43_17]|nr:MAG: Ribose 5-phosphate isomerase B [candidate division TM6 bacterium GW2011_GWF2_43_17]